MPIASSIRSTTSSARAAGKPLDIATAYFSISGYRIVKDGLHKLGAFRLLLGTDPQSGADVGLKVDPNALKARIKGDLEAEPFTEETLKLVEDLIAYLQAEKVKIRLYDKGFLHAKAYLFHQDKIGPQNLADRMRPFAAIVGSSNFTGPGLAANRELNLVHRVFLPADDPRDADAARGVSYLGYDRERESILDPSGVEVPDNARRFIKSEVGARAIADLMAWYEARWAESIDFKNDLIDLLDASKFGGKEYTPYQVYIKALYEYFKDEFGADAPEFGRSAVDLAEFQEDSVKKARRILLRYDGVLIADSVGLGKTWIGKKLLEDFAYHRRQKAVVVCSASLRAMWTKELASATIAATILGSEELGRANFDAKPYADFDVILIDESHNFRNEKANRYLALDTIIQLNGGRGRDGDRKKVILLSATPINNDSERIGALERGFSSPTRPLIIVVFRHSRRKGNDHAQAQTQPTATSREDPTATAGSPRGDPGRDPGRPAADRNQTPRWARDPHRRRLQVLGARDRGTDQPTVGPPDGRGDASRSRRLGEPAPGPLLGSRGGSHDQGSRPTRRHAPDDVRPGHRPGDLLQPQL